MENYAVRGYEQFCCYSSYVIFVYTMENIHFNYTERSICCDLFYLLTFVKQK